MLHITKTLNKDIILEQIKAANPDMVALIDSGEFVMGLPKVSSVNEFNTAIALHNGEDVNNLVKFYYNRVPLNTAIGEQTETPLVEIFGSETYEIQTQFQIIKDRLNTILDAEFIMNTEAKYNDCSTTNPNLTTGAMDNVILTALDSSLIFIPGTTLEIKTYCISYYDMSNLTIAHDKLISDTLKIPASPYTGTLEFDLATVAQTDLVKFKIHPAAISPTLTIHSAVDNDTTNPGDTKATMIPALRTDYKYRGSAPIYYNRIPLDRLCFHIDNVKIYNGLNSTHDIIDMLRIEKNVDIMKSEIVDSPILDTDTEVTLVAVTGALYLKGSGTLTLNRQVLASTDLAVILDSSFKYMEGCKRIRLNYYDTQLCPSTLECLASRDQIFIDEIRKLNNFIPLKMSDLEVVNVVNGEVTQTNFRWASISFVASVGSQYSGAVTLNMLRIKGSADHSFNTSSAIVYIRPAEFSISGVCDAMNLSAQSMAVFHPTDFKGVTLDEIMVQSYPTVQLLDHNISKSKCYLDGEFKDNNLFYTGNFGNTYHAQVEIRRLISAAAEYDVKRDISEIYDPANNYWENSDSGKTWYLNDAGYLALRKILVALDPVNELPYWNIQRLFKFKEGKLLEEVLINDIRTAIDPGTFYYLQGWRWSTRLYYGHEGNFLKFEHLLSK